MDRVAYKPLGTSPPDGDEAECELDEAIAACNSHNNNHHHHHHHYKYYGVLPASVVAYLGLRQLRILLYVGVITLFLIFIVQLSTNASETSTKHLSSGATIRSIPSREQAPSLRGASLNAVSLALEAAPPSSASSNSPTQATATNDIHQAKDVRPEYDSYLSSVLRERNSQGQTATKEIYDDLHFPIDEHTNTNNNNSHGNNNNNKFAHSSPYNPVATSTSWWRLSPRDSNKYVSVTNYIRAMKSFSYNASLTLTTQATTEFMYHTLELCKRWDGPISVAVFSPGTEMQVSITLIKFMRHCLPGPLSACIRDKVSWHMVYNRAHGPPPSAISYPKHHLDSQHFPLFVHQDQCPKFPGPEPADSIRQFELELKKVNKMLPNNYRQQFQLTYPINVLRNTARLAANTKYVLASDIELYPSINLVPSFVNFINKFDIKKQYHDDIQKFVFTLPIFEVKSNVTAPKTKRELVKMIARGDAVFFHKYVCDACQNFPNRLEWMETDKQGWDDYHSDDNELVIFEKTQRDKTRDSWEPIFIGTNDDPLYDDSLTWDGRRDKMAQMYEMCLQDYHLMVLGNAFLVHAPGIKHIDKNDTIKRLKYIRENNAIYDATMAKLKQLYSTSSNINKC